VRKRLDQALSNHRRVEGRATACENDAVHRPQLGIGHVQAAKLGSRFFLGNPAAHGIAHRVRLLVDFLEHVVRVFALVHRGGIKLDTADLETAPRQRLWKSRDPPACNATIS
jgi:hypothetical protein